MKLQFQFLLIGIPPRFGLVSFRTILAVLFLSASSASISHEVPGISQAEYSGHFYEGCRRNASAKYCQCIQDQYGTHFESRAEMIAAMLGAGPQAARMMRHAVSYCRDGKSSVPMGRSRAQREADQQREAERRQRAKEQAVQRRTALIVKHLSRKPTLNGLVSDSSAKWRFSHFTLHIEKFSEKNQSFVGTMRWQKMGIRHAVSGRYSGARIDFEEIAQASSSKRDTKCKYHVTVYNDPRRFKGKWQCDLGSGNISLDLPRL